MDRIWIVVAHRSGARIFRENSRFSGIERVETLENPEGRLQGREMVTDRPGRVFSPKGPRKHGLSAPNDPEQQAMIDFAKQLAARLDEARSQRLCQSLVLVAGPEFLGQLRAELSKLTSEIVLAELNKNLDRAGDQELMQHLDPLLEEVERKLIFGRTA